MASASGVSTLAEDLLCPICLSIFQEPQMLGCGHNFCLSCLESCVPKGQLEWPCPECRQLFSLQEQAPNRALASLAEKARRLKLDEMPQEGGAGGCDFCEEHDEPLKLFCTQDKGPICVICRDLPQHQGHEFLPIKNAAKLYQEKFQVCLSQLEEGRTQSYDHQIQQKESMARLESYTERLLDRISSEFKILHQLLQEKKKSLVKIAADIKEEKLSEMEGNMLYLQDNESSHMEVISLVRAALETPDCFTFLRGVKELMGRVQECLGDEEEAAAASEEGDHDEKINQEEEEANKDEEGYEKKHEEEEDGSDVLVDPAFGEFKSLNLEAWLDFLRTILSVDLKAPALACSSPPPAGAAFPPRHSCISMPGEESLHNQSSCPSSGYISAPGEESLDKQPPHFIGSYTSMPRERPQASYCSSIYPISTWDSGSYSVPQVVYRKGHTSAQGRGFLNKRLQFHPRGGPISAQGRGSLNNQPHYPRGGYSTTQGRGSPNNQPHYPRGGYSTTQGRGSPNNQPHYPRGGYSTTQGRGSPNKQSHHSKGGDAASPSEGTKNQQSHSRGGHIAQARGSPNKQRPQHRGSYTPAPGRGSQNK